MPSDSLDKSGNPQQPDQYGTFGGTDPNNPGGPPSPGEPGKVSRQRKFLLGDETPIQRIKQFLAEFIGLFIFVFIGSLSGVVENNNLAGIAAAHGFTIGLLIMCIGHISGGHLNPAVTVGLLVNGSISLAGAFMYIVAQCLGAILGALGVRAVLRQKAYLGISGGVVGFSLSPLDGNADASQAWLSEVVLTFILVFTVLFTAVDRSDNVLAPLAIGLAVFVDILAGAAISGASMNPARSFGPACIYSGFADKCEKCADPSVVWAQHYIHWVGPICGALLAGVLYRFAFAWDKKKES